MGLQGDEECPGCDIVSLIGWEQQCTVVKKGLGCKGSDGDQGRMIGDKWYCGRHGQRLYRRIRREGGKDAP
jgi:hypothetical protein